MPKFFHWLARERFVEINYSLLPTLFSPTGSFVVEEQKMQQAGKCGNRIVILVVVVVSPDEAEHGQSTVPRMVGEAEGVAVVNRR